MPANFQIVGIIIDHDLKQLIENSFLLPGLKPFMQSYSQYLEQFPLHRFPLASTPQPNYQVLKVLYQPLKVVRPNYRKNLALSYIQSSQGNNMA